MKDRRRLSNVGGLDQPAEAHIWPFGFSLVVLADADCVEAVVDRSEVLVVHVTAPALGIETTVEDPQSLATLTPSRKIIFACGPNTTEANIGEEEYKAALTRK